MVSWLFPCWNITFGFLSALIHTNCNTCSVSRKVNEDKFVFSSVATESLRAGRICQWLRTGLYPILYLLLIRKQMHSVADFKMFNTFFFCVMYESRIQLGLLHIRQANLYEIKTLCDGSLGAGKSFRGILCCHYTGTVSSLHKIYI